MGVTRIPGPSASLHQVRRAILADRHNQVDTQSLSAPTPKTRQLELTVERSSPSAATVGPKK